MTDLPSSAFLERGDLPLRSAGDRGSGLAADDAEHLFDRFGSLATQTSSSSGLGLSIARGLARAMGGELTYRRRDIGSSFVLTLPAVAS